MVEKTMDETVKKVIQEAISAISDKGNPLNYISLESAFLILARDACSSGETLTLARLKASEERLRKELGEHWEKIIVYDAELDEKISFMEIYKTNEECLRDEE